MALTPKRERFCQLMASGKYKTITECFIESGYGGTSSKKFLNQRASRLAKDPAVRARIEQLKGPKVRKIRLDAEEKAELLREAIELAQSKDDARTILQAVDLSNKMDGSYQTQETHGSAINLVMVGMTPDKPKVIEGEKVQELIEESRPGQG